jgi:hypothetical protein
LTGSRKGSTVAPQYKLNSNYKRETKMANPKVQLTDVTLMWAALDTKNTMSEKYQVDITNLSPENVEKLAALGLQAKTRADKPEKGAFFVCKSLFPIVPLDTRKQPLKAVVGNGTKANVIVSYYIPKRKPVGAPDRSPTLLELVITDLIEFVPNHMADNAPL